MTPTRASRHPGRPVPTRPFVPASCEPLQTPHSCGFPRYTPCNQSLLDVVIIDPFATQQSVSIAVIDSYQRISICLCHESKCFLIDTIGFRLRHGSCSRTRRTFCGLNRQLSSCHNLPVSELLGKACSSAGTCPQFQQFQPSQHDLSGSS
jgi:hypothetical protein